MNQQAPEKRIARAAGEVEVHSIFPTIQGEGPFVGQRATFIRLAGCNLQCPLCDTEYTSKREVMRPHEVFDEVFKITPRGGLIVITGGEPFRQKLSNMVDHLVNVGGYRVQIETNGTLYDPAFPFHMATIVCSPKAGQINPQLARHITALKYVLKAGAVSLTDGLPITALDHPASPRLARPPANFPTDRIYVQPVDEKDEERNRLNLDETVKSVLRFGYTLCLQVHKIIDME